MIRVTTHVYPRLTLQSLSHYHYLSCTLRLPLSASRLYSVRFWFWFAFCLSAFVHGVQARRYHSGTHSASSCTIRLSSLVLVAFVFRAIIIPLVTDCYGRQTYLVAALLLWHTFALAKLKHAPMARQLSSCRLLFIASFQALFLLISD